MMYFIDRDPQLSDTIGGNLENASIKRFHKHLATFFQVSVAMN